MTKPECESYVDSTDADSDHVYRWEISPHPYSTDYDIFVTDSDEEARQAAMDAAESIWDDMEAGIERAVTIKRNLE